MSYRKWHLLKLQYGDEISSRISPLNFYECLLPLVVLETVQILRFKKQPPLKLCLETAWNGSNRGWFMILRVCRSRICYWFSFSMDVWRDLMRIKYDIIFGKWDFQCVWRLHELGFCSMIFLEFIPWFLWLGGLKWRSFKSMIILVIFGNAPLICTWTTLFNALILSWDLINHDYMKEITQNDV